jgi:hypothetical protein
MKGKVSVFFYRTVMVFALLWGIGLGYAWHYIATLPSTVQPHPEYDYASPTFEWMDGVKFEEARKFHGLEDTVVIFRDKDGRLKFRRDAIFRDEKGKPRFWRDRECLLYTEAFERMWERR